MWVDEHFYNLLHRLIAHIYLRLKSALVEQEKNLKNASLNSTDSEVADAHLPEPRIYANGSLPGLNFLSLNALKLLIIIYSIIYRSEF